MMVQLESAYWVIVGSEGNGPLSFHRQEREVKRCSVKPASRSLPHSKKHNSRAFAREPCLDSQLGMGRPRIKPNPNPAQ